MSIPVHTTWQGFEALALENERLRIVVLPQLGGKIVSLFDKLNTYEWLVEPMRPLRPLVYGADFVSQDMSGWDEMLPTITACCWDGALLPDHGEVWSVPWQVEPSTNALSLSVAGTALPYQLTRRIRLSAENVLEFAYTLFNPAASQLPFLWAAHPQFAADSTTRLILPDEVEYLVNVIAADPAWGAAGSSVSWPTAEALDGQAWTLDRVGPANQHTCRKFYVAPEQPVSWAALKHGQSKSRLRLEWDTAELPYLGIWVDEGAYNSRPAVALEPSNGYYDNLVKAVDHHRCGCLKPGSRCAWTLRVVLNG